MNLNISGSSVDDIIAELDRRKGADASNPFLKRKSSTSSEFSYGTAFVWSRQHGVVKLGTLGGKGYSFATDINHKGEVVGFSNDRAFLWKEGAGMIDLGTLNGGYSEARGINDRGQVVGCSGGHAFLWSEHTGMRDLGTIDGQFTRAYAINNAGMVVGDATGSAFTWTEASGISKIDAGVYGARAVNTLGQVEGAKGVNPWLPITWGLSRGIVSLGSVKGPSASPGFALDLNAAGVVVGVTDWIGAGSRAFRWTAREGMADLGNLGGHNTFAVGINSRGTIVGWGDTVYNERRAFIWSEDTGIVDFLGVGSMAESINDRGQVVGGLSGPPKMEEP
ncbi:MAG: hypothetical protein ABI233_07900 [Chthoniobacterales bacterium]